MRLVYGLKEVEIAFGRFCVDNKQNCAREMLTKRSFVELRARAVE